tara:strand:- start:260 stop:496 length:237 start_codon:yes stop_codon:yes gene_type:complete
MTATYIFFGMSYSMSKKRFRKGDLVRHTVSKKVGVILAVVKRKRMPVSLWVLVEGERKRWAINTSVTSLAKPSNVFKA